MTIIELEAHRRTITTPQGPVSCIDVGSSTSPSICLTWAQTSITSLDGRSRNPFEAAARGRYRHLLRWLPPPLRRCPTMATSVLPRSLTRPRPIDEV
jgi:hypothetical protein